MKLILILCPNLKFQEFCSGTVIFCTIHYSIAYSMVHIFCNTMWFALLLSIIVISLFFFLNELTTKVVSN